jgi:DNA-binding NtrC family response regulator
LRKGAQEKIYYKGTVTRWKNLHLTQCELKGQNEVDARITLHEGGLGNLLGRSPAMKQVFALIQRVAPTEATVMIMGESGSGKELVAECIHLLSHRAQGPLVAINCGSIPASLIEAELFGYEKAASRARRACTPACSSALPAARCSWTKSRRCRWTCRRGCCACWKPGGSIASAARRRSRLTFASWPRPIATSPRRSRIGSCARILMYRLAVFPAALAAVARSRWRRAAARRAFPRLAQSRQQHAQAILDDVREALRTYRWPGNVRELKNAVERSFILADDVLDLDLTTVDGDSRRRSRSSSRAAAGLHVPLGSRLDEAERSLIE